MQRTHSGRPARIRPAMAIILALLLAAVCASILSVARASASAPSGAVTVRVEGPKGTLVPATGVLLSDGTVVKDGVATDSCSELSAAGGLGPGPRGGRGGT